MRRGWRCRNRTCSRSGAARRAGTTAAAARNRWCGGTARRGRKDRCPGGSARRDAGIDLRQAWHHAIVFVASVPLVLLSSGTCVGTPAGARCAHRAGRSNSRAVGVQRRAAMSLPLGWWSWFSINMIHWLAPSLVLAAICLAVVRNAEHRWLLPLAALLLTFDMALVTAPHVGIFSRFAWNWQGKLLESAWPLLLGATGTLYSLRTIGFAAPRRDSWPGVLVAAALALAFASAVNFAGPMRMPVDAETAWFESTLPGWSEELLFRGVLLWATNEVFGGPGGFAGGQLGWGWITPRCCSRPCISRWWIINCICTCRGWVLPRRHSPVRCWAGCASVPAACGPAWCCTI